MGECLGAGFGFRVYVNMPAARKLAQKISVPGPTYTLIQLRGTSQRTPEALNCEYNLDHKMES